MWPPAHPSFPKAGPCRPSAPALRADPPATAPGSPPPPARSPPPSCRRPPAGRRAARPLAAARLPAVGGGGRPLQPAHTGMRSCQGTRSAAAPRPQSLQNLPDLRPLHGWAANAMHAASSLSPVPCHLPGAGAAGCQRQRAAGAGGRLGCHMECAALHCEPALRPCAGRLVNRAQHALPSSRQLTISSSLHTPSHFRCWRCSRCCWTLTRWRAAQVGASATLDNDYRTSCVLCRLDCPAWRGLCDSVQLLAFSLIAAGDLEVHCPACCREGQVCGAVLRRVRQAAAGGGCGCGGQAERPKGPRRQHRCARRVALAARLGKAGQVGATLGGLPSGMNAWAPNLSCAAQHSYCLSCWPILALLSPLASCPSGPDCGPAVLLRRQPLIPNKVLHLAQQRGGEGGWVGVCVTWTPS